MKKPSILITRSEPGASRLAKKLLEIGFDAQINPLLQIEKLSQKAKLQDDEQGFVITSAAAAFALPDDIAKSEFPIFCVGPETAKQVALTGAKNVIAGVGNGKSLAKKIARHCDNKPSKLVWLRGEIADETILNALAKVGIELHKQVCYRANSAKALAPNIAHKLANGDFALVAFHSKRGAEMFRNLKPKMASSTQALAYSQKTAEPLDQLGFGEITICSQPNDQSLIATLCQMFSLS